MFYPEGLDPQGRFQLMRLRPRELEVVSLSHSLASGANDWMPNRLVRGGGLWEAAVAPDLNHLKKLRGGMEYTGAGGTAGSAG